uniref:Uncharacterized protein n=1 Tax=Vitrella brassicaformis TaxID=1169539 RepID=A0A6U4D0Y7_9ALVE|mmetsp:Transcript_31365/g.77713  ORF Transcript_31365/g.77713 Transcript_31365/m.77713 type:complete len:327 (+) Transcript_31365:453-1433(+)
MAAPSSQIKHDGIWEAVRAVDVQSVAALIDRDGKEILDSRHGEYGVTPFLEAARDGHVEMMSVMIDRYGPAILQQTGSDGRTVMHWAADWGHVDVLKAIYVKGGQEMLTQRSKTGDTPLHYATSKRHSKTVAQLLELGGSSLLDVKNNSGWTPMEKAARMPQITAIMERYRGTENAAAAPGVAHVEKLDCGDGYAYTGPLLDGKRDGPSGKLVKGDELVYRGEWKDDLPDGQGQLSMREGFYEGQFRNGLRHGRGKFMYSSGRVGEGPAGKFRGSPAVIRKLGRQRFYDGEWENDLQHGEGTYLDEYGMEATYRVDQGLWHPGPAF